MLNGNFRGLAFKHLPISNTGKPVSTDSSSIVYSLPSFMMFVIVDRVFIMFCLPSKSIYNSI